MIGQPWYLLIRGAADLLLLRKIHRIQDVTPTGLGVIIAIVLGTFERHVGGFTAVLLFPEDVVVAVMVDIVDAALHTLI